MKLGNWFEKEGIISNNRFTQSKEIPERGITPLFELSGDFDSDIAVLCSTLVGIEKLGYGPICKYPLFLQDRVLGTSQVLEQDLLCSLLGLQETIDILFSKTDRGAVSTLAFKLLNTDIDDFGKASQNEE